MVSVLVVLVMLVLAVWLASRAPGRTHGCCGGPWPPDDLGPADAGPAARDRH